jgi:hypothetical protein
LQSCGTYIDVRLIEFCVTVECDAMAKQLLLAVVPTVRGTLIVAQVIKRVTVPYGTLKYVTNIS